MNHISHINSVVIKAHHQAKCHTSLVCFTWCRLRPRPGPTCSCILPPPRRWGYHFVCLLTGLCKNHLTEFSKFGWRTLSGFFFGPPCISTGALAPWAVCRWLVVSSVASVVCGRAALWPTYFWAVVLVRQFTCDLWVICGNVHEWSMLATRVNRPVA